MKGKEFVFRTAAHSHVSEFMQVLSNQLRAIVADGVEVKLVNDGAQGITKASSNEDLRYAFISINSLKLLMDCNPASPDSASSSLLVSPSGSRPTSLSKRAVLKAPKLPAERGTESLNQVSRFAYSLPFTKDASGKAHAKNIDEQWMRVTTLTVKEPFPYVLTRQAVLSRSVRELSPIEVAINDIQDKIEEISKELDKNARLSPDNNNLMRLLQGIVLPQASISAICP